MTAYLYKVTSPSPFFYHAALYVPSLKKFIHNSANLKNKIGGSIVIEDKYSFLKNRNIIDKKRLILIIII